MLTFAAFYLTRFALGLRLPQLPLAVPIWYIPLTGALWGIAALTLAVGLFMGRLWSPAAARWGAVLYSAWYWIDSLWIAVSPIGVAARNSALALNVIGVAVLFAVLSRPKVRRYFRELEG